MAFAGLWTNWTCVRKAKEGEITADVFGFLTCQPNAEVGKVHPKVGDPDHYRGAWWNEAKALQRPLQDGSLRMVAAGEKEDAKDSSLTLI